MSLADRTQEIQGIDNDVKAKFSQYNQTKSNLVAAERRRTYAPTLSPPVMPH